MNIGSFLKSIIPSKAAKSVIAFALTEEQKAVAALKQTAIGAAVAADIKALKSDTMSGQQKFEEVVKNTLPLIVSMIAEGGVQKTVKDVEDIGRALVQSVFNDVASTKAGSIATTILKLLGIK